MHCKVASLGIKEHPLFLTACHLWEGSARRLTSGPAVYPRRRLVDTDSRMNHRWLISGRGHACVGHVSMGESRGMVILDGDLCARCTAGRSFSHHAHQLAMASQGGATFDPADHPHRRWNPLSKSFVLCSRECARWVPARTGKLTGRGVARCSPPHKETLARCSRNGAGQ